MWEGGGGLVNKLCPTVYKPMDCSLPVSFPHRILQARVLEWGAIAFSLQCNVCLLSHFSCVRLFATLWTVPYQALLSMGFSRQEHWSGLPCPPPGNLPDPGIEPLSPAALALQADSLPLSHQCS